MLKDSETPRYASPRVHRTYSSAFKAQLVAACQQPGASIAALALAHGMNANVLHRWIKEHARSGRHQIAAAADAMTTCSPPPAFLPVQLPAPTIEPAQPPSIRVELHKGALSMEITWPVAAAAECAAWMRQVLQ